MTSAGAQGHTRRPPDRELFPADADFADVTCPDCDSAEVEVASLFGSTTSEVLFSCTRCRSFFNWVKWQHRLPPVPARRVRPIKQERMGTT